MKEINLSETNLLSELFIVPVIILGLFGIVACSELIKSLKRKD